MNRLDRQIAFISTRRTAHQGYERRDLADLLRRGPRSPRPVLGVPRWRLFWLLVVLAVTLAIAALKLAA